MNQEKKLVKNSIYSVVYRLVNVLFPLVFSVYSSRVLTAEGVGKVTLAQTIVNYFIVIAALGIPNYGIKKIGATQYDRSERSKVFSELFIINFLSTFICSFAFIIFFSKSKFINRNILYLIFSFHLFLNIFNVDWLYSGIEEYRYIAIRSVAIKILCLIALPLLVRDQSDINIYAALLCFATVGNYLFNIINLHKYVDFRIDSLQIKRHFKPIFILLASACATEIYTMLDSTMVGTICSETDLGYYANAIKTVRMTYVLITAACTVFLPRLSLYYKEGKQEEFNYLSTQGLKLVLFFSLPIFIGMELLADRLIPLLFGNGFLQSILTLRILAVLLIVFSVAYISGHLVLIASDKEKYTMYASFAGATSNFILNLILLRAVGFNGAAVASVIAEILVTIVLVSSARECVKYSVSKRFVFTTIISTVVMGCIVIIIKRTIDNVLISCFISVLIGGMVYLLCQLLLNNDLIIFLINMGKRKYL